MLQSMNFLILKHNKDLAGKCFLVPLAVRKRAYFVFHNIEDVGDFAWADWGSVENIVVGTVGILEPGLHK